MMDLSTVPTDKLREEIVRRDREAAQKRVAERQAREVTVLCPTCEGSGVETYFDMRVAVGEDDGQRKCLTCRGNGRIVAVKA